MAALPFNPWLSLRLALRSLSHRKMVALATMLGVAIGVCVVNAVLIVDANTQRTRTIEQTEAAAATGDGGGEIAAKQQVGTQPFDISVKRNRPDGSATTSLIPTQRGGPGTSRIRQPATSGLGEADYQAMRLAVRLASLLAFFIGAVIVFYTMRYSVSTRAREFSLMMCLGESRRNVATSLVAEASLLGATGTVIGTAFAFPAAAALLAAGVLVLPAGPSGNVVEVTPSVYLTSMQITHAVEAIAQAIEALG